jgi:hypothetical protein
VKVLNAIEDCPRLPVLAVVLTLLVAGCSSGRSRGTRLTLHVDGPVARASRGQCVFILQAAVREGGDQRTCLTTIEGFPAPRATMHSKGLITFALPRGAVVVRVRVTQRFADDGAHARQKVEGVILRGRGEFAGAHGSLRGGGAIVDSNEGLRVIRLAYQLTVVRH